MLAFPDGKRLLYVSRAVKERVRALDVHSPAGGGAMRMSIEFGRKSMRLPIQRLESLALSQFGCNDVCGCDRLCQRVVASFSHPSGVMR